MHDTDTTTASLQDMIDWAVFMAGTLALSTAMLATAFLHIADGAERAAPMAFAAARID